jgi:hypothetical protein
LLSSSQSERLMKNVEEFFYGEDPNAPENWSLGPV